VVLAVVGGIAVQLEVAPVGRQLRAECPDVTGSAGLAGLDRKEGTANAGSVANEAASSARNARMPVPGGAERRRAAHASDLPVRALSVRAMVLRNKSKNMFRISR
jgi:hypothetical protein